MDNDTLTMALDGDVPLNEFAQAMEHFNALVAGLSSEIAQDAQVEWIIDSLDAGSAVVTVKGVSDRTDIFPPIGAAYIQVGKALQSNGPMPYSSERIINPARAITQMLDGNITSVRFETAGEDIVIASHYLENGERREPVYAFGAIKGTVQTLSRRRGIRFILYDALFDRAVSCYLKAGEEDKVRGFWGKKVIVSGLIGRSAESGKPFAIRDITKIEQAESSTPGSYRLARGIIRLQEGETAEGVIRRLRDG